MAKKTSPPASPAPRRRRPAAAPAAPPFDVSTVSGTEPPSAVADRASGTSAGMSPGGRTPTQEEIAEAAYHRYLRRGGGDGSDFDDWVEAERELRSRRES